MNKKTFDSIMAKGITKKDIKSLIAMAKNEIKEWDKFIKLCNNKLKK